MAVDFVSPENVEECLRLTEEFRQLPKNHKAREDKLEVTPFCNDILLVMPFDKYVRVEPNKIIIE